MRQKTSLIVLSLLLSTQATQLDQKSDDFQTTNLGNKISNMAFMMMNSKNTAEQRPDQQEMLQLDSDTKQKSEQKLDKGGLDTEEITDLLKETFAQKQQEEPTVGEILAEEDNKEKEQQEGKKEDEKQPEVSQEDTMSFTEQLEQAKTQQVEEEKKAKKEELEKKKNEKEIAKKAAQKKTQLEEAKKKKAKDEEDALGDPFDEKANLSPAEEKAKNMQDEISRAESNQGAKAPKDVDDDGEKEDEKKDVSKPKAVEHFKDADEAMDNFGKRLAEHQLQANGGGLTEDEEKPKPKKKEAKKVAKKPEKNADFDDDELKAIDKIKMGDEKPKSFKEYQMEQAQEELNNEKETEKPAKKVETSKTDLMKKILAKHKKEAASAEPTPSEDSNVQKSTDIHLKMPKLKMKSVAKKSPLDLKALIKSKTKKIVAKPAPVEAAPVEAPALPQITQFAPKIEEQADTSASAPKKEISSLTQKKIQAQFKKELSQNGDKAPSDITEALADSQDFGDVGKGQDSEKEPEAQGFFGKYLKKHRDAKKKATDAVLQEEKETKQRLIEKMNEKIAEKASPSNQLFQGSSTPDPPKKTHKLTLSERTAQKFIQQEQKQQDEAKAGQGIALEVQSLTQVDDQQQTADEIVAQVFGSKDK